MAHKRMHVVSRCDKTPNTISLLPLPIAEGVAHDLYYDIRLISGDLVSMSGLTAPQFNAVLSNSVA